MKRVLRVIEYIGTADWVDSQITRRHVKGTCAYGDGSIHEAILGDVAQLVTAQEIEERKAVRNVALAGTNLL